jgi:hypothetical protein
MAITIGAMPKPHHRKEQYDALARELAPAVAEVRASRVRRIRDIAQSLNEMGLKAPSGEPFEYSTTRFLLRRLAELRIGDPPRSRSTAASNRLLEPGSFPKRQRRTSRGSWMTDVTRKHPREFEGLE